MSAGAFRQKTVFFENNLIKYASAAELKEKSMGITKQELEAERFVHRGMRYLRETFPTETKAMDDGVLKNRLINDCEFVMAYGFETERDVMGLVDLLWRLPEDFKANPDYGWVEEILSDKEMDASLKTEALQNAYALFAAVAESGKGENDGTEL